MAEPAVIRPAQALDTTIEFRFNPTSPVRARCHGPRPSQRRQPFFQIDGLGSGEAARKLADVAQSVLACGGYAESLDAGASCLIANDDAGHDQGRFDLTPGRRTLARQVTACLVPGHHPLVAFRHDLVTGSSPCAHDAVPGS